MQFDKENVPLEKCFKEDGKTNGVLPYHLYHSPAKVVEGCEVELHFPRVFRLQLGDLQLNGNEAF
jgi:hypothetical protein